MLVEEVFGGTDGKAYPSSGHFEIAVNYSDPGTGFRATLYKDEGTGPDGGSKETPTYIPEGYTQVVGTDLDTGFVVQDESGNEYVWVEVPKTATVYSTAGLNIVKFTDEEYTKIENDLQTYTSTYRNGTTYTDTWSSQEATGLTEDQYNTQKKKMLKSIYKNGGFYVGRYETGIEGSYRTEAGTATETPVIKQNVYPYNYVTNKQAQELSESFATEGYSTSLMFGVQWDLILKYLETKGSTTAELNEDSTNWGNYKNTLYNIENANAKYTIDKGKNWLSAPYSKTEANNIYLTTGGVDTFAKQNIYDLAGNGREWTLEYTNRQNLPCSSRGGYALYEGTKSASSRWNSLQENNTETTCFRTTLYKDEGTGSDAIEDQPYIPAGYTRVAGTDLGTGYVVRDSKGNEYVWVEVPRTTAVYATAGLNITSFTEGEYEKIENDLQTYTSTYRNGTTYTDTWSSQEATGLTETQYFTQKKKMLKSIYKNGGFYVGRYETGTETARTPSSDTLTTAVIKQNVYPYNYVTNAQAQELSETFATEGYSTSLMFGVQWDLIMKYLEMSGSVTQEEITTNSSSWGNHNDSSFTITSSAKYTASGDWYGCTSEPYVKESGTVVLLTTGASDVLAKQNIYDLAGNAWEWTLENTNISSTPCVKRGGESYYTGSTYPVNRRHFDSCTTLKLTRGFRTTLYKDEWEEMDNYTRYYDASNLDGNGATGTATTTIKDLSGEYDGQIEGSPTFGNGYISLNEGSTTDFIDIGPMLDKSTMTIDVKVSLSNTEFGHFIGNWESGGGGLFIKNGKVKYELYIESESAYVGVYSTTSLQKDTIYDIKGVYDGKNMYIYINGTLEASLETAGGNIKNPTQNINMIIGGNPDIDSSGEIYVYSTTRSSMKLYSASITSTTNHPNILTSSMCSRNSGTESWDGTTLKIDSSAVNTNISAQFLGVQKYLNSSFVEEVARDLKGTGSYNCTFTKDSSFDHIRLKLNGNVRDDGLWIDVSSLTNGKTYKLSFDVTEYGEWTATITNIKLQLQS